MHPNTKKVLQILSDAGYRVSKAPNQKNHASVENGYGPGAGGSSLPGFRAFARDSKRGVRILVEEKYEGVCGCDLGLGFSHRRSPGNPITRFQESALLNHSIVLSMSTKIDGVWGNIRFGQSRTHGMETTSGGDSYASAESSTDALHKNFELLWHGRRPEGHPGYLELANYLDGMVKAGRITPQLGQDAGDRPDTDVPSHEWAALELWIESTKQDFSVLNATPAPYDFSKPMYEHEQGGQPYLGFNAVHGNDSWTKHARVKFRHFYLTAAVVGVGTITKHNCIDFNSSDVPDKDVWFVISGSVASKDSYATCFMLVQPQDSGLVWHPLSGHTTYKIQRGHTPKQGNYNFRNVTEADEVIVREAINLWIGNDKGRTGE